MILLIFVAFPSNSYADDNIALLDKIFTEIKNNEFENALNNKAKLKDDFHIKLVNWWLYQNRKYEGDINGRITFIVNHQSWPNIKRIANGLELYLKKIKYNNTDILDYFNKFPPKTTEGKSLFAYILYDTNIKANIDKAKKIVLDNFVSANFDYDDDEKAHYLKFKKHIPAFLLKQRMQHLLKKYKHDMALFYAKILGQTNLNYAKAIIALNKRDKNAKSLYKRLNKKLKNEPLTIFSLIRYERRMGNYNNVKNIFSNNNFQSSYLLSDYDWWSEQRIAAINLIAKRQFTNAYRLVKSVKLASPKYLSEQEFMAGFIALNFLKNYKTARAELSASYNHSKSLTSKIRARYWYALAYEKEGNISKAQAVYKELSKYNFMYYGQLATGEIRGNKPAISFPALPAISQYSITKFKNNIFVKAANILLEANQNRAAYWFFSKLAYSLNNKEELLLLINLAKKYKFNEGRVKTARIAGLRGLDIELESWPDKILPKYNKLSSQDIEAELVYAIIRQESEFTKDARSYANAQGLMQLLPSTAKLVANKYKVKYKEALLMQDEVLNMSLGTAYLADLIKRFEGSYLLAIAGYNAGPGNVGKWIKQYGKPSHSAFEPKIWVELIPFSQTRKYVKHVLSNLQVFRSRWSNSLSAKSKLHHDLARGH